MRAKLTLYNKTRLIQDLKLSPQKEIDRLLTREHSDFQNLNNKYVYLNNNKNEEIKRRLHPLPENLENIKKIKKTNEYKGAVGELAAIKNLENLPQDYFLLNDLFLELNEYINFQGSRLRSAQIDHLVVGPTGVYIIEVKNWSYEYVQKVFNESSYTPYDQIQRSSYLIYRYLNSLKYGNTFQKIYFRLAKGEIRVKSIIAVTGADIPYIKEKHTAVVRSNELSDYIKKGSQSLSSEEAREIAEKLSSRVL
ncbi:nuclease-related domain-containing protein [Methanosarcina sp. MSH10X1]|uniref:nuclease-related domain-containing protein n=1 Tax=Methanosarcina sp. MSH10X1 TaxID=2507075 RepID=UPI0013E2AB5A|nr:nuclease-related domain-containing protein [Methanosarcina sp. MSH10X1]